MELREWQYMNKPATSSASSTSSGAGNKSFKKRFDRLIQYYGQHLPAEVDYVTVNLLTPGSLNFTEHLDNGDKINYDIFLDDFDTVEWRIKYSVNNQLIDDYSGTGWEELLYTLDAGYIDLPKKGTSEYKNLLTEWVVMNNKTSSSGYKKRFEKLIKYHIDHASSELERVIRKDIKEDSFHLGEHYTNGHQEFDRAIIVSVEIKTDTFFLSLFVDGREIESIQCKGYEDFVDAAGDYMFLPNKGTPEYDNLLQEWVVMKGSQNNSSATVQASALSNKEKFTALVEYMEKHKDSYTTATEVTKLDNLGFVYKEHRASAGVKEFDIEATVALVRYTKSGGLFSIYIDKDGQRIDTFMASGWEDLLRYLKVYFNAPGYGSPEHKLLCESLSSELREWQYINPPKASQPASSTTLYKNKFKKLLDYHMANDYHIKHGSSQGTVELLSEDSDKALFKFKDTWIGGSTIHETIIAAVYFKGDSTWWVVKFVDGKQKEDFVGDSFNELVKKLYRYFTLPATNSSEYQALLEEVDSFIADDFKLYENLWD